MSALRLNDEITFSTMTPDGRISGSGRVAAIFPAGNSRWLHILQADGTVRMLFEANAQIQVREAVAA